MGMQFISRRKKHTALQTGNRQVGSAILSHCFIRGRLIIDLRLEIRVDCLSEIECLGVVHINIIDCVLHVDHLRVVLTPVLIGRPGHLDKNPWVTHNGSWRSLKGLGLPKVPIFFIGLA